MEGGPCRRPVGAAARTRGEWAMNLMMQGLVIFLAAYGLVALVTGFHQGFRFGRRGRRVPILSILLLVRDREETVEGLVLDLLSAGYLSPWSAPEFELIVVDDRSHDGTPGILERLARRQIGMRVVRLPGSAGPEESALEVGSFLCRSPVILVLDARGAVQPVMLVETLEYLLGGSRKQTPSKPVSA